MHHRINIDSPMHFNLKQECRYPMPSWMCLGDLVTILCFCWSLLIDYTLKAGIWWVTSWKPHQTLIELHCKPFMLLWSSSATFSWHNTLVGLAMPLTILMRSSTAIYHYDFSSNHNLSWWSGYHVVTFWWTFRSFHSWTWSFVWLRPCLVSCLEVKPWVSSDWLTSSFEL
jgi:hypothetical protein